MTERRPLGGGWSGDELARDRAWVRPWQPEELAALEAAAEASERRGLAWHEIGPGDFPLGDALDATLTEAARDLEDGRGLVKLTGLPVLGRDPEHLKRLWFGLAGRVGRPLHQDCHGQLLREIRDEGGDLAARHGSLPGDGGPGDDGAPFLSSKARTYSSGTLRYHTDRCDVVGLLCVGQAARGGVSKVASTIAIHDAILARRPDLLEQLYRPIPRSRLGEEAGGEAAVYHLPVFGLRDGKLTSHFSRTYIEAAQRLPGTPRLSDAQWQALDLLAEVAEELSYAMVLEPGDIQLLNNHVVYHARTPFEDDAGTGRVRRLYRVWLSMPRSRALPADHAVLWGNVEAGAPRGGIGQEPVAPAV